MDNRQLQALVAVADNGTSSAAADALATVQSNISAHIARLERELGATLVDRGAGRLTEEGQTVVDRARRIEAELEAIAGLRGGRLRMASFESGAATLMPLAIADFRERHPLVELSLAINESEDVVPRLRAGDLDLALIEDPHDREPSIDGVELVHLLDDPMYLLLPRDHPLASKSKVRLRDLADDAWIQGQPNESCACNRLALRACQAAGFEPRIAFHSDDYLAIQGFVAAGVGVSLIPDLALLPVRDDVAIRSLAARPPVRSIEAATLRDGYRSPAVDAMLDVLAEVGARFADERRALALAS